MKQKVMIAAWKGKAKDFPGFGKRPKMDLKGVVFCKAKKCDAHLYKNESSSLPGYCSDCG